MKKLTALALAGVLCLGMSTVAFAAPSVGNEDAIAATGEVEDFGAYDVTAPELNNWVNEDSTVNDKAIRKTFSDRLDVIEEALEDTDNLSPNQLKALEDEKAALEMISGKNAKYEFAYFADLTGTIAEGEKVNVRFDLNNRLEGDLKVGDTINILHATTEFDEEGNEVIVSWEVYPAKVKLDGKGWYTDWDFDHFSPVAVVRVTDAGPVVDPTEPEDPTEPTEPTDPTVPTEPTNPSINNNGNGTITADQLADLIVKKLQQNAAAATKAGAVVRTAGKASPKTGE